MFRSTMDRLSLSSSCRRQTFRRVSNFSAAVYTVALRRSFHVVTFVWQDASSVRVFILFFVAILQATSQSLPGTGTACEPPPHQVSGSQPICGCFHLARARGLLLPNNNGHPPFRVFIFYSRCFSFKQLSSLPSSIHIILIVRFG